MTKIQLRRDTAANWSTNNPTPSAGEPCFETDTGKLKIGDGSTAYNNLAYQGGGSTPDNMVTTDTEQTISGKKTFTNDIIIEHWNSNVSPTRPTIIDFTNGNGNTYISASGTTRPFGLYSNSSDGIQIGTDKIDSTQGLSVKPSSLTFKSSDGTVTDLLAGGSGDSLVKSVDSNFTVSEAGELSLSNTVHVGTSVTANTIIGSTEIGAPALRLGSYAGVPVRPEITYTAAEGMKINARALEASGNIMRPVIVIASEFKSGDNTTQYEVVNKSPANNTYMAHMAMPSDKYIDLELGASGATYTAPADGYYRLTMKQSAAEQYAYLASYTTNDEPILSTTSKTATGTDSLSTWIAVHKGQTVKAVYNAPEKEVFRFIYTIGSEPQS